MGEMVCSVTGNDETSSPRTRAITWVLTAAAACRSWRLVLQLHDCLSVSPQVNPAPALCSIPAFCQRALEQNRLLPRPQFVTLIRCLPAIPRVPRTTGAMSGPLASLNPASRSTGVLARMNTKQTTVHRSARTTMFPSVSRCSFTSISISPLSGLLKVVTLEGASVTITLRRLPRNLACSIFSQGTFDASSPLIST